MTTGLTLPPQPAPLSTWAPPFTSPKLLPQTFPTLPHGLHQPLLQTPLPNSWEPPTALSSTTPWLSPARKDHCCLSPLSWPSSLPHGSQGWIFQSQNTLPPPQAPFLPLTSSLPPLRPLAPPSPPHSPGWRPLHLMCPPPGLPFPPPPVAITSSVRAFLVSPTSAVGLGCFL